MPTALADPQSIRAHFPGLASSTVFLDNAGGSQVPACVADAIRRYLLSSYAQLGGEYPESLAARRTVNAGHDFLRTFMGGDGLGHVVLGASTTQLCYLFANCFADGLAERPDRDELIISTAGHESDVGPWMRLATRGFTVKTWTVNDRTLRHEVADLRALLSPRTRLVAFPHVSNLLGDIEDARAITRAAHEAGARVLIDGVAFAPHRTIDVADIGCDFYLFSTYKVFGPHAAALFGRQEALSELTGPNHYFIPREQIPYKFELGGVNHEACAGLLALPEYLRVLAGEPPSAEPCSRGTVVRAFERITALELPLQARLIEFLTSSPEYRLIGPARADASRVCTISLVSSRRSSREIALAANAQGLGLRFGSFYSNRLARQLGLDETDGVVRISLAHYNTLAEVDRAIAFLKS
jgi:cysteine desulfurase family protein (TIGR01976 family)